MVENIDVIQSVADNLGTQDIFVSMGQLSNAITGLDSLTDDPIVLDILGQIYTLMLEIGKLTIN